MHLAGTQALEVDITGAGKVIGAALSGGTITAAVTAILLRRKHAAEGREIEVKGELQIVDGAVDVVKLLREELDRITERVEGLELQNVELTSQIRKLEKENKSLKDRCRALENENELLRLGHSG